MEISLQIETPFLNLFAEWKNYGIEWCRIYFFIRILASSERSFSSGWNKNSMECIWSNCEYGLQSASGVLKRIRWNCFNPLVCVFFFFFSFFHSFHSWNRTELRLQFLSSFLSCVEEEKYLHLIYEFQKCVSFVVAREAFQNLVVKSYRRLHGRCFVKRIKNVLISI